MRILIFLVLGLVLTGCHSTKNQTGWVPLFPKDGVPAGWVVRAWDDVSKPSPTNSVWRVENGVLTSEGARGCWLMEEQEFGDFELQFEFRLGARGNSGLALRAPMAGDPAFDGLELQMADYRYNPEAKDSELTGGIYRVVAPRQQVYRPLEWNRYEVSLMGSRLKVTLNDHLIQDIDLSTQTVVVKRHDGRDVLPLKDRPRRGHIGFQELSRDGSHVEIRNARIRILD
ncbi:MAG TPA: DUF1080 domain-containing protein [Verrucomicrobiota bacterium]|nr:DUF1080 domain-containing protein [Verrucomicrobiota bacterium]